MSVENSAATLPAAETASAAKPRAATAANNNQGNAAVSTQPGLRGDQVARDLAASFVKQVEAKSQAAANLAAAAAAAPEGAEGAGSETTEAVEAGNTQPAQQEAPPETSDSSADSTASGEAEAGAAQEGEQPQQAEPDTDVLSQLSHLDGPTRELIKKLLDDTKQRWQGKVDKRIGKEVAKTKQLQEEATSLRQQLEQLKVAPPPQAQQQPPPTPPPVLNPNNPLGKIEDVATLNQKFAEAKDTMRLAEDLLAQIEDTGTDSVTYEGQQFNKQTLRAAHRNAKRVVEDYAPQQFAFLQHRNSVQQAAYQQFPYLRDRNSPEYVMAQQERARRPWLAQDPEADLLIGLAIEGIKALNAKKSASAKPAQTAPVSKPKPPASQTAVGAGSGASRAADSDLTRSRIASEVERAKGKGNLRSTDVARILKLSSQLQTR